MITAAKRPGLTGHPLGTTRVRYLGGRMPSRLCACGVLLRGGDARCADCLAKRQGVLARRGRTVDRGYDQEHRALRTQWKPQVDAGQVECHATTCLAPDRLIQPGSPWQLGHTPDRTGWTGPEHQRCGSSDGARRRHARDAATR